MKSAHSSFGNALRRVRNARGIPQEAFDNISSRTYVSSLERGVKQPTLSKVDELAEVLEVHPLSLLTLSYCRAKTEREASALLARVLAEIEELLSVPLVR